jgi:ketosteroid isomerase-like protein
MTEQKNIEIVREFCSAFQRGDLQGVLNTLSEEIEFIHPMSTHIWPWAGKLRGHEGIINFGAGQLKDLDYDKFEPREFIAQGNKVVLLLFERFRIKETDLAVDNEYVMVFTVSNGKIVQLRVYEDTAPIIAAIRGQEKI